MVFSTWKQLLGFLVRLLSHRRKGKKVLWGKIKVNDSTSFIQFAESFDLG
jgi:hypothetical protein